MGEQILRKPPDLLVVVGYEYAIVKIAHRTDPTLWGVNYIAVLCTLRVPL
jgi:hypothetical protein